jgi:phosphate transport system permease protein
MTTLDDHAAVEVTARAGSRPRRRPIVAEVTGAALAGVGAGLLVHSGLGLSGVGIPVIVGYIVFIGVIALAEYLTSSPRPVAVVDLTTEEAVEALGPAPVPAEPVRVLRIAEAEDAPRKRPPITFDQVIEFSAAALGGAAVAELLRIFLRMDSLVGLAIWWYVAFIAIYFVLARDRADAETALDRVVTVFVWSVGMLVASVLLWMVIFVIAKGLPRLAWSFFTDDLSEVGPLSPGGGAKHAIIGTLEQVGIATVAVVPIGIMTAVYLNEVRGRLTFPVRFIVDAMSGLPSIVAGLLIFSIFVDQFGYSGFAGSLALAVLMLPTMTRASYEILRTVPDGLREGALALGAPQWRLVHRVVLPTAIAGLVTAALLAVARAIGETAPLLLTAFGSDSTNVNPFHGPQSALPLFVWKLILLPNETQKQRAWTGALILITIVFILFVSARIISSRGQRKLEGSR